MGSLLAGRRDSTRDPRALIDEALPCSPRAQGSGDAEDPSPAHVGVRHRPSPSTPGGRGGGAKDSASQPGVGTSPRSPATFRFLSFFLLSLAPKFSCPPGRGVFCIYQI